MRVLLFHKLIASPTGSQRDLGQLSQIHSDVYPILFRYIAFRVGDAKATEQLTNALFTQFLEEGDIDKEDPQLPQQLLLSLVTKAVRSYHHNGNHPVNSAVSKAKIREALTTLPETQQVLLALHYGCFLTVDQVAQILAQSPKTIRQLRVQAIMALHTQMQCP